MRRHLAKVLTVSPWLLALVGVFGKGAGGVQLVVALLVWIAAVAGMLLVATLIEASRLKEPEDE